MALKGRAIGSSRSHPLRRSTTGNAGLVLWWTRDGEAEEPQVGDGRAGNLYQRGVMPISPGQSGVKPGVSVYYRISTRAIEVEVGREEGVHFSASFRWRGRRRGSRALPPFDLQTTSSAKAHAYRGKRGNWQSPPSPPAAPAVVDVRGRRRREWGAAFAVD
ncbi:MAG: hypothetical protein BJ554DRAFT_2303, partial [Olpidium bornovanus]